MALGLIESYNRTRYSEELLERLEGHPPSFTVHLHPDYWVLNNGSKFLYHNQLASILDDIRAHRIPVDFLELFENAGVPFYEGCMVVELLDYRPLKYNQPQPDKPEKTRVILHPNPETQFADICNMNKKCGGIWTDKDALEVEAKLLLATTPPLCLDPNPHLTRIANHVLRASTPTVPMSLKRKAAVMEQEEDESEKIRRAKIMAFMAPRQNGRKPTPSYTILDSILKIRKDKEAEPQNPAVVANHPYLLGPPPRPQIPPSPQHVNQSPTKTEATPQQPFAASAFTGKNTPVPPQPPQPTVQFIPQNPQPPVTPSPAMQPKTYANVQAATEAAAAAMAAANRAATPAQQQQLLQAHIQQQQQHQLQMIQKVHQQQKQAMQTTAQSPTAPQVPQPSQNLSTGSQPSHRNTPTPQPAAAPTLAPPTAVPYQQSTQQFVMHLTQPPSQAAPAQAQQQPQQQISQQTLNHINYIRSMSVTSVTPQQLSSLSDASRTAFIRDVSSRLASVESNIPRDAEPVVHQALAQLKVQYQQLIERVAKGNLPANGSNQDGRATPAVAPNGQGGPVPTATPSPARNPGVPNTVAHPQMLQQNGQQGQPIKVDQQRLPQQQAQQITNPQQPQQLGTGQFTFSANFGSPALRANAAGVQGTHLMALQAQANAAKAAAGTPAPQPSPQQQHAQQQQQQQQHQQQQQQQHSLQAPQVQHQQLRTPQMAPQQLRTPQMQAQQLRVPQQMTPQQQLAFQQQQQLAQQRRQATPQQPHPQVQQGQLTPQQQQQQRQLLMRQHQVQALAQAAHAQAHQQQQHAAQGNPQQNMQQAGQQQQQYQMYGAYPGANGYARLANAGQPPPQVTAQQYQWLMQQRMAALAQAQANGGNVQHPTAVSAQALAVAAASAGGQPAGNGAMTALQMQQQMAKYQLQQQQRQSTQ